MARKADLIKVFEKCVEIFLDRHLKYGSKLTKEQALNLMQLKLDRLKTNGDDDSALDLANYAAFYYLMNQGQWDVPNDYS